VTFVGLAEQVVEEAVARKFDELVVRGCLGRLKGDNRRVAGKESPGASWYANHNLAAPRICLRLDGLESYI